MTERGLSTDNRHRLVSVLRAGGHRSASEALGYRSKGEQASILFGSPLSVAHDLHLHIWAVSLRHGRMTLSFSPLSSLVFVSAFTDCILCFIFKWAQPVILSDYLGESSSPPFFLNVSLSLTERSNTSLNRQSSPFPKANKPIRTVWGIVYLKSSFFIFYNQLCDITHLAGIIVSFLIVPHLQT